MKSSSKGWAATAAHPFIVVFLVCLFLAFAPHAGAQQQTFEPRIEEPEEFPDFPGREDTFFLCATCHNFKLVAQQGMSRARWDGTLDLMTARHGMPKLEGEDRKAVLDYLEKAFPESAEPRGWRNPFLR